MRIALAQISSPAGEVARNLARHVEAIEVSRAHGAELVVFPELSLCGYEPEVLRGLAFSPGGAVFEPLRDVATRLGVTCAVGVPLRSDTLPRIALLVHGPSGAPRVIEKRFLHEDERPYFSSAPGPPDVLAQRVGVAICYELGVEAHEDALFEQGHLHVYLASVAKCQAGVERAAVHLERIARTRGAFAVMVNCVGSCEGRRAGGRSLVYDATGHLLGALDEQGEAVLLLDTHQRSTQVIRL